jgi:Arc/MetJ family transcription regulator
MPMARTKVSSVRTTVRIDDELYRRVKQRAASERRTVAAVLEDAVRVGMAAPESQTADRFVLVPTGEGGLQPGVELSSNAALREVLDDGLDIDSLR